MAEGYVYRFKNAQGEILYIGKSLSLVSRMSSHVHLSENCYKEVCFVEYTVFDTVDDAIFAESYYISKIKPVYNTLMIDRNITFSISELEDRDWHDASFLVEKKKKENELGKKKIDKKDKNYINNEIINHYPYENTSLLAKRLGMSKTALRKKASRLGVKRGVKNKIVDGTKRCCNCNRVLSLSMFWRDSSSPTGYAAKCIDCKKEYNYRNRIKNNKLNEKIINKKIKKDINDEIIKCYPLEDTDALAKRLGISNATLRKKASRLGIKRIVRKRKKT